MRMSAPRGDEATLRLPVDGAPVFPVGTAAVSVGTVVFVATGTAVAFAKTGVAVVFTGYAGIVVTIVAGVAVIVVMFVPLAPSANTGVTIRSTSWNTISGTQIFFTIKISSDLFFYFMIPGNTDLPRATGLLLPGDLQKSGFPVGEGCFSFFADITCQGRDRLLA
jgi:hypothetical protein